MGILPELQKGNSLGEKKSVQDDDCRQTVLARVNPHAREFSVETTCP